MGNIPHNWGFQHREKRGDEHGHMYKNSWGNESKVDPHNQNKNISDSDLYINGHLAVKPSLYAGKLNEIHWDSLEEYER